jgi:hypothetical protein
VNRTMCIVLTGIVVGGCGHTPVGPTPVLTQAESQFEAYVRNSSFTVFVPPRDGDGTGSVVSFNDRREESIVASATDCFKPDRVIPASSRVVVLDSEYELTTNDKVMLGLPALFKSKVDFSADLGNTGVRKVKYKLVEPYTTRITLISARNYFRQLAADDPCRKLVDNQGNLLIHMVLGAKGVEYSFYGENDAKLTINAEILKVLKVEPQFASKYNGTSSIKLDSNMLLGYRAWQLLDVKGIVAGGKDFVELTPVDVERMRSGTR